MSVDIKDIFLQTDASGYDDQILLFVGKNLYTNRGHVDYDYDKLALKFQKNADETDALYVTYQILHKIDRTASLRVHAHIVDPDDTNNIGWKIKYRFWKNNETAGAWSDAIPCTYMFPKLAGKLNIIEFIDIDISSCNVSDMVDIKFYREDDVSGNAWLKQADAHAKIKDVYGSKNEWGD